MASESESMFLKMTVDEAIAFADEWSRGMTLHADSQGWRVVCLLLADEVRRLRGAPRPMASESETVRAEFEKAMQARGEPQHKLRRDSFGEYVEDDIGCAWIGFQAARSSTPSVGIRSDSSSVMFKTSTQQTFTLTIDEDAYRDALDVLWKARGYKNDDPVYAMFAAFCVESTPSADEPEVSSEAKDAACEWRYHDNDGAWFTSCGQAWSYIDGGPVENGMNFCHCCGKAIAIAQQDAQRGGEVDRG